MPRERSSICNRLCVCMNIWRTVLGGDRSVVRFCARSGGADGVSRLKIGGGSRLPPRIRGGPRRPTPIRFGVFAFTLGRSDAIAECNSAIRQITNLRYGEGAVIVALFVFVRGRGGGRPKPIENRRSGEGFEPIKSALRGGWQEKICCKPGGIRFYYRERRFDISPGK